MARARRSAVALVLSAEHGGNAVPAALRRSFRGKSALLASHRGWDPGALQAARALARALGAPLVAASVTRLVVDLNRSLGHPRLFSETTRAFAADARAGLIARHWRPHRERVEALVRSALEGAECVVHVAVHSFTPVLDGRVRDVDVGLLYDPRRSSEQRLRALWKPALERELPGLAVRCNRPYAGTSDGLTTSLRRLFPAARYAGFELELNQRLVRASPAQWAATQRGVARALDAAIAEFAVSGRAAAARRRSDLRDRARRRASRPGRDR